MKAASLKRIQKIVRILSDGEFHSGEFLANSLGVSRTAIWKLINKLQEWQIDVTAIRGKGYQIPDGLTLLDKNFISREIKEKAVLFSKINVLPTVDSTSSFLTRAWQAEPGNGRICIAEHQTQGRGRKGRKWFSPFGSNLYFSLGLNLPIGLSALGGLSLAVGIGLTKLLNRHTNQKVSLKWPNDLLVNQRKLAGILVEASGDSNDSSFLNIGIGINWNMLDKDEQIGQPWANLQSILNCEENDKRLDRNEILSLILLELDQLLVEYIENGFESFRKEWSEHSAYYGKAITLQSRSGKVSGTESGIDKTGAIRIKTREGEKTFYSGEVSLRAEIRY